ncbi:MAG: TonB-dependent receptor [Pseudomonadota bacterium]
MIIVTAQRREERLIDVPISLAALGSDELENQQISELRDFVGQVPNLQVNNFNARSDTVRLFIRGIGQNDVTLTQDPSVALYVDGIYVGTTIGGGFETDDLERVEVLRGPQGTLYGRNATGGAVNLISARPDPSGFMVRGSVRLGNYDLIRGNLTANIPLTDTLAVRGTIVRTIRDGWIENTGPGRDFGEQDRFAMRAAMRWMPSDAFTLDYAYDYSENRDTGTFTQPTAGAPGSIPVAAPFDVPGTFGLAQALTTLDSRFTSPLPFTDDRVETVQSLRPIVANDGSVQGHSITAEYEVSDALTLRALFGHRIIENEQLADNLPTVESSLVTTVIASALPTLPVGTVLNVIGPNPASRLDELTEYDSTSIELQALGTVPLGAGSMDYVIGGYYYEDDGFQRSGLSPIGAGPIQFVDFTTIENQTIAAFGQFTIRPFEPERFSVTVGGRYSSDERAATRINERSFSFAALGGFTPENCAFFGAQGFFPPGTTCDPTGSAQAATYDNDFEDFSFSVTLAYKASEDLNFYARYAQGYKAGGTSQRSANPINFAAGFQPETVNSYELGIKANLFDRRVTTSLAGFYMELEDFQTSVQTGATAGDRDFIGLDNNEIYGVEFEITAALTDNFRIGANAAILETTLGESSVEVLLDTGQLSTQQLIDEQAYAPSFSGSAWMDYSLPLSDNWEFGAYAIVSHQSDSETSVNLADNRTLDSRTLVDANISFTRTSDSGGVAGLRIWAKNLFDVEYRTVAFGSFAFSGATTVAEFGEPRTYGVTAFFEF